MSEIEVKVGQIWRSKDKREERLVEVLGKVPGRSKDWYIQRTTGLRRPKTIVNVGTLTGRFTLEKDVQPS